jgi:hypothetical protein
MMLSRLDGIGNRMAGYIYSLLWCPEELAGRWWQLPRRIGYAVDLSTPKQRQQMWARIGSRNNIDPDLVTRLIDHDQSGVIGAEGKFFFVSVALDLLQERDSTCSWWIQISEMGRCALEAWGYRLPQDVAQHRRAQHVMATLVSCSVASAAESALGEFPERLFLCSLDLARDWPTKILDPQLKCDVYQLYEHAALSSTETYLCGAIRKAIGGVIIHSGPALHPESGQDAAYLALQPQGYFRHKALIEVLTRRLIGYGAHLLEPSSHHLPPNLR